ncbi:MAG TPA: right-handed parallel beta-helix repeat-containing protein [Candidatus Cybelea sp.]|nr:right-handed parallel beta-helix repeat-containing protein [Candidatus Cybelea sp.]
MMANSAAFRAMALRFAAWLGVLGVAALLAACAEFGPPRTLKVGAGQEYATPSAAARAARDGDTVEIEPGEYVDCAVWQQDDLTIVGLGTGATLSDKSCQGKGIFVIYGSDVTIRNITFARARVADHNGAGIRAQGQNLTVEHSRFIDNEDGILASSASGSTIRIVDSEFTGNGVCADECAHGIYVNRVALLHIEHSKFFGTKEGHHIKSRAYRTELIGNDIRDGDKGNSSYLVDVPNGGALIMEDNTLEKGPNADNQTSAITIGAENASNPAGEMIIRNNRFTNDMAKQTIFVRNMTPGEAVLIGNRLQGQVVPLTGKGTVQ